MLTHFCKGSRQKRLVRIRNNLNQRYEVYMYGNKNSKTQEIAGCTSMHSCTISCTQIVFASIQGSWIQVGTVAVGLKGKAKRRKGRALAITLQKDVVRLCILSSLVCNLARHVIYVIWLGMLFMLFGQACYLCYLARHVIYVIWLGMLFMLFGQACYIFG